MKKRFLAMAVCVSACMPVSALGAEIAGPAISGTAQENTDNKEETVSEEAIEKKDSGKIEDEITEVQDTVTVAADTDVLDYPGRKEGSVIGEVLEEDEISRTGTIDDIWSRILFEDDNGEEQVGYIPTSVLEGYEDKNQVASDATSDGTVEAGIIHKSTGEGVFAEAVEGVTQTGEMQAFLKDSRLWFPQTAAFVHLVFSILPITASAAFAAVRGQTESHPQV